MPSLTALGKALLGLGGVGDVGDHRVDQHAEVGACPLGQIEAAGDEVAEQAPEHGDETEHGTRDAQPQSLADRSLAQDHLRSLEHRVGKEEDTLAVAYHETRGSVAVQLGSALAEQVYVTAVHPIDEALQPVDSLLRYIV